jgi:hypothetical protein
VGTSNRLPEQVNPSSTKSSKQTASDHSNPPFGQLRTSIETLLDQLRNSGISFVIISVKD